MAENFEMDDFEFTPPEFDISLLSENSDDVPVFTAPSVENTLEETPSFEAPSFENENIDIPNFESPVDTEEVEIKETPVDEKFSFEMPEPEIPSVKQEEPQEKIANAIREKMSEIQNSNSYNMTEDNADISSFENTLSEEIPSFSIPQKENLSSISKEEMFENGIEKLRNITKNESANTKALIENEALTK